MKIIFTPEVYVELQAVAEMVRGREFSGYGFVNAIKKDGDMDFEVYDFVLLDVGNPGYTEFSSEKILEVMKREDADKMKLWIHRHPVGNGVPGPQNWSKTDHDTCTLEPLGCPDPRLVRWALAAVLTPHGWVGRMDMFPGEEVKTEHIPVHVKIDQEILNTAARLLQEQEDAEVVEDFSLFFQDVSTDNTYTDDEAEAYVDMALDITQQMWEVYLKGTEPVYWEDYEYCENIAETFRGLPHLNAKIRKLNRKLKRIWRAVE